MVLVGAAKDKEIEVYLQTLVVLLLLLIYNAQAEIDFIGFLKIWLHMHDLRKSLFGMLKRSITVIQNANPIP